MDLKNCFESEPTDYTFETLVTMLENEDFEKSWSRVHDWRNYIPQYVRDNWNTVSGAVSL